MLHTPVVSPYEELILNAMLWPSGVRTRPALGLVYSVALADVAVSMSASSAVVFFMVLSLLSLRVLISPGFSFVLPAKAPCVD
ncbi:hypothetical protein DT73_00550 [Mangrovibacter sp. MFB070]|nr:hypothetical protein DT73_00550 [Mangrovibacter sp. MFB070]